MLYVGDKMYGYEWGGMIAKRSKLWNYYEGSRDPETYRLPIDCAARIKTQSRSEVDEPDVMMLQQPVLDPAAKMSPRRRNAGDSGY